jgi:hypothetical protein
MSDQRHTRRLATAVSGAVGALILAGCTTGGNLGAPPPKEGPGVTKPVKLSKEASKLHRCTVTPLAKDSGFPQSSDLDVKAARERAVELDSTFGEYSDITERIQAQVTGNPWKRAMAGDQVNLVQMVALSLKYAAFRSGRSDYTADVAPVLDNLDDGEIADAGKYLAASAAEGATKIDKPRKLADGLGTLGLLERGSVHLAAGNLDCARKFFDHAVADLRKAKQNKSVDDQIINAVTDAYAGTGFEAIMAIDYKAMAGILNGDDGVRNNIKLSRAWQSSMQAAYGREIAEAQEKYENKQNKNLSGQKKQALSKLTSTFKSKFEQEACVVCDDAADRVPTPYVNPLGDFLSAAWAERKAALEAAAGNTEKSGNKRNTALQAYREAADLRPDNQTIQNAIDELEGKVLEGEQEGRLVHVVLDVGRAPERRVAKLILPTGLSNFVPLQIPFYKPVERTIDRVRIHGADGESLARVTPLADVEAMALSHFNDKFPIHMTKAALSAFGNYMAQIQARKAAGGGLLGDVAGLATGIAVSELTEPGTEAWVTLPHTVGVARLRVPENMRTLELASYDGDGTKLATETVRLRGDGPVFVYGRGIRDHLEVQASEPVDGDGGAQTVKRQTREDETT